MFIMCTRNTRIVFFSRIKSFVVNSIEDCRIVIELKSHRLPDRHVSKVHIGSAKQQRCKSRSNARSQSLKACNLPQSLDSISIVF